MTGNPPTAPAAAPSTAPVSGPAAGTTTAAARASSRVWAQRVIVVSVWIGAVVLWRNHQTSNGLGATGSAQQFIDAVEMAWWGVAAYVGVYLARPIVLFPASVLTVVGGILFGPLVGVAVVVVAANTSAMIAYAIGRSLGRAPVATHAADAPDGQPTFIARWSDRLRTNSFETVLVMRLLFLPYDLVNYASGLLRIRPVSFLTATALGSLPGTVSFVLIGASLDRVDEGFGGIDPVALIVGVVIFVVSLTLARRLKSRQRLETI